MLSRPTIAAVLALLGAACVLVASPTAVASATTPTGEVVVFPPRVELVGPDSTQQLVVDLAGTAAATYASADATVADVESTGRILAKGDGSTVVTVRSRGAESRVLVVVRGFASPPPTHFANQVVPVFTRLGCNSGGCHGKASGQNGFRLSLLGFEPTLDYETLVYEDRGRRVFPAAPDRSLLLEKATARVPHGGGRRMEPGSHEYRVVRSWIEAGMPVGRPDDPTVAGIAIYPEARRLEPGSVQQVAVTATYTDGRVEDVTRWSQYQSNDPEVAVATEAGQVRAAGLPGQAAIMARYQGRVAIFRATVPLAHGEESAADFASSNPIDRLASKQWRALGIAPSADCSDAEFIRRASLDILGTMPTGAEIRAFVALPSRDKRARLVDRLLERPEYAAYFAIKWADILRNKRDGKPEAEGSTFRFHDWIRESLARNVPYDQFVRGILTATGTPETSPPVMWYRKKKKVDEYVDDTAQVFLGMRLQCAKCHHHPFEVWGQDDYYGFAAFFGRVKRKPLADARRDGLKEEVILTARTGTVAHPVTGRIMAPRGLGDPDVATATAGDPRERLVDWMVAPNNRFFARSLVNRYWAHFLGRGIVEPIDDIRLTNPPSNPELLDALAGSFVDSGYDLKALIRVIATSRVYSLSSVPTGSNARDHQSFARHYPRRLGAEVLLDAISQMTGSPTPFDGLPAGTRAIELPDEGVASGFLDAFGRPRRETSCECERVGDASLGQSLMMINSADVQSKLSAAGGRAGRLADDPRPDEAKVDELFWDAFARPPDSGEATRALAHLAANPAQKRLAYEDILWALLNAKEFQFND